MPRNFSPRLPVSKSNYLRDMGRVIMLHYLAKHPAGDCVTGEEIVISLDPPYSLGEKLVQVAQSMICNAAMDAGSGEWLKASWEAEFKRTSPNSGTISFTIRKQHVKAGT